MANKIKTRNFPTEIWRTNLMQVKMSTDDRLFWVYINTNPQTTLLGVFPLTVKQISCDLGYNETVIKVIIKRFVEYYNLIKYNWDTGEIAILDYMTWGIKSGGNPVKCALSGAYEQLEDKTLVKDVYEHITSEDKKVEKVVHDFFATIDWEKMKKLKDGQVEEKKELQEKEVQKKETKKKEEKFNARHEIERSNMGSELKEALYAFLEMRKSMRAPVTTARALNGLLNSLDRLGTNEAEKIQIVDQSTECGWKSFYELKQKTYQKNQVNTGLPDWYAQTEFEPASPELIEKALEAQRRASEDRPKKNQSRTEDLKPMGLDDLPFDF